MRNLTFGVNCGVVSALSKSVGVGITFDGNNLWYSCYGSQQATDPNQQFDLYKADPTSGEVLASYNIAGGLGAVAYDAVRNVIWAGEGGGVSSNAGKVIQIQLDSNKNFSGTSEVAFPVPQASSAPSTPQDTVDGLAIDTTTDTLYIHYQSATSIQMYKASDGTFLGSILEAPGIASGAPVMTNPPINSCVVSGLAIGGSTLFEASEYCDDIWAVDSSTQTVQSGSSFNLFSTVGPTADLKALTCDPNSFPAAGDAIWVKDVYTPAAYAFQIPLGSCGFGGQPQPVPAATLSPASLAFPVQAVGTASSAQALTLTNSGTGLLSISSLSVTGTNSSDFVQSNNCPASLGYTAPSNTCTIWVTFNPTASGARTATLTVVDNAASSPQTASLSGTGGIPSAVLSTTFLSYPVQAVGTTSSAQGLTLTNSGTAALTISSISITGTNSSDFFQTNTCPASLGFMAPNNACAISVTFKPTAGGARTATLAVVDNAAGSPQTVTLTGSGTTLPTLTPLSLSFGTLVVGTTSSPQVVTLTNPGSTALSIKSVAISGQNRSQYAQTNNCGTKLAAGSTCAISVTFKPTAGGSLPATLTVTDGASNSPQTASLSGSGLIYSVKLSTTSLSFSKVPVGTTSAPQSVTVTNTGNGILTFSGIAISGTNSPDFAQTSNCGSSLTQGAGCTISVTFRPSVKGNESATLSIGDNVKGSPQLVALKGSGS